MRQLVLPRSYQGGPHLELEGKESQYLTKVLRLKRGQQILGRDTEGRKYLLTLIEITSHSCILSCQQVEQNMQVQTTDALPSYQGPYPNLVLLQCLCKGRKEEQIFRQATEIGAATLALVSSRYCVTDLSDKKEKAVHARFERLEIQIKEALQQSGSPVPTQLVSQVLDLQDVPSWWADRGLAIFFHQSTRSESQKTLTSLLEAHPIEKPVCVLIGPEGGFSNEECTFLEQSGFYPVVLKTNILRSETAGVYALSAIQVLLTETYNNKPVHLSQ